MYLRLEGVRHAGTLASSRFLVDFQISLISIITCGSIDFLYSQALFFKNNT